MGIAFCQPIKEQQENYQDLAMHLVLLTKYYQNLRNSTEFVMTQGYLALPTGENPICRADNMKSVALLTLTAKLDKFACRLAMTQYNLATAYRDRIKGTEQKLWKAISTVVLP